MPYKLIEYYRSSNVDGIKDISLYQDYFKECCEKIFKCEMDEIERRDIVKYLIELFNNDIINLRRFLVVNNFWLACYYGRYNIVLYLVELYKNNKYDKINIQCDIWDGFVNAYHNGHYMIVKYLMKLYKKHKYEPVENYLIIFDKFNKFMFH